MTVERTPIVDRKQWLALRDFNVGGSEVGALWGLHPYKSHLYLFVDKQFPGTLPKQHDSGPMRRGRIMEASVRAAVEEERPNWQIEKCQDYFHDDELGLAATPDFFIHGDPRGLGVLQAKTAAPSVYAKDWVLGDGSGKAAVPTWIVLQATTEMMLTGAVFGAVAVLVVDPYELPCHIFDIPRHEAAEKKIKDGVVQFWKDIERGKQPDIDTTLDRDLLKTLMPHEARGITIDLSGDNEVIAALNERAELRERIKEEEARCKAIETLVMGRMKDAERAIIPDFNVTWKTQHREGYTVEPSDPRVLLIREKRTAA